MGNSAKKFIEKINEVLAEKENAVVNIINDKLTISVFTALEKNLKNVKEINFIIRDTKFIPKNDEISREFEITPNDILYNSYDIKEKNKLKHFAKAKAMYDFIKNNVNVRKVKPYQKVNGNILIIDDDFMIQGTSSLEIYEKRTNRYDFDTTIKGETEKSQILGMSRTYAEIWNNNDVTQDYKQELLESLEFVYKNYNPKFLYYFTLNELFGDKLDSGVERFENDSDKFKKTEIWNSLFDFQKDCVVSAIQKLQKYGGCIIADSVGLGKTFEALAVIKYFEIRNDNVLVLTPAKLYDNWRSFTGNYKDSFLNEMFNYKIMFHTDLSRTKGESKSGYELSRFDWSKFDLVVIDESHNFRNRIAKYDENDELIMNRYFKLLHDVIKSGKNTKVLLLSATPVNNSLVDLKNQISIITSDHDDAFSEQGISSVGYLLKKATQVINDWEKEGSQKKDELLDNLPSDFYKLLEMMTISRSRKHITNYYGTKNIGKFPQKNKPITYYPEIDSQNQLLNFKNTNSILEELNLSVYTPTKFIKSEKLNYYINKYKLSGNRGGKMDFDTQSKGLVYLHRTNLFKRLESSVFSFSETLKRLIENIDQTIENLNKGQQIEENLDVENEDEIYIERSKYEIKVEDLRINAYLEELYNDRDIVKRIYDETLILLKEDRDNKIHELEKIVGNKVDNTPYNPGNRKILIFTAFADTANYIYSKLLKKFEGKNISIASVTGKGVKTSNKKVKEDFHSILSAFSPKSKMKIEIPQDEQIDIIVGTDCISEGQNLQDCDTVINFDIQWNPVSLIQRFGRIDRIGSKNDNIQMINFFPNADLNEYLDLERRVKGKMTTLNIASTGDEDMLNPEMNDFNFRKRQLEKLKEEVIDIEDTNENISLTDLNMNEYLYELSNYVNNHKEISKIPKGIYSVTEGEQKGVLFCFKHSKNDAKPKNDSSLYPYYLIFVDNNKEILFKNSQAREVIKLFRQLCYEKNGIQEKVLKEFFKNTKNATEMGFYSELLNTAVNSIKGEEEEKAVQTVFDFSGFNNNFKNDTTDDFELVSFLVVG